MIGQPQLAARARGLRRRMTGRCRLVKVEQGDYDEETHSRPMVDVVVWSGPCLIRPTDTNQRRTVIAGDAVTLKTYSGWLPMDAGEALGQAEFVVITEPVELRLVVLDAPVDMWPIGRRIVAQAST